MILIIGYGNVLRGDDGIGWQAATLLRERFAADDCVQVEACHQLMPELAEPISRASLVIFLDAADSPTCDLLCVPVEPLDSLYFSSTHHLTPARLLAMARNLYGHCPRAFALSVGASNFEVSEQCSESVQNLLPDMVSLTLCLIASASSATQRSAQSTSGPSLNHEFFASV